MTWTNEQTQALEKMREHIHDQTPMTYDTILNLASAFNLDPYTCVVGIGGTRIIITHPTEPTRVWKMAYRAEGLIGNQEEYEQHQNLPYAIEKHIMKRYALYERNLILEAKWYQPIENEEQFEQYADQLDQLLTQIDFVHYQDPPYYHSFGVDDDGNLILLDFGETEAFRIKNQTENSI